MASLETMYVHCTYIYLCICTEPIVCTKRQIKFRKPEPNDPKQVNGQCPEFFFKFYEEQVNNYTTAGIFEAKMSVFCNLNNQ